jgi:hypothetical protein
VVLLPPAANHPIGGSVWDPAAANTQRVGIMFDFLMIAAGVGFFAISILYVLACEKM